MKSHVLGPSLRLLPFNSPHLSPARRECLLSGKLAREGSAKWKTIIDALKRCRNNKHNKDQSLSALMPPQSPFLKILALVGWVWRGKPPLIAVLRAELRCVDVESITKKLSILQDSPYSGRVRDDKLDTTVSVRNPAACFT